MSRRDADAAEKNARCWGSSATPRLCEKYVLVGLTLHVRAPSFPRRLHPRRETIMRKTLFIGMLALAGQLLAGGFFLQLGNPEANTEAKAANAAILVKAAGCHDPATAEI